MNLPSYARQQTDGRQYGAAVAMSGIENAERKGGLVTPSLPATP